MAWTKRAAVLFLACAVPLHAQPAGPDLADMVNPLMGTDSSFELSNGNTYPAIALDATHGVSLQEAGRAVSLYWGGAMAGRLIGSALLARINAAKLLAAFAAIAATMCANVLVVGGADAGFVTPSIGLFNSIMFPTIFTLTLERPTASPAATSGLLCTAIVGGAPIPLLVGTVSQATGYRIAFIVPATCYLLISLFAIAAGRSRTTTLSDTPALALH